MNFHIGQNCTVGWTNHGAPTRGDNVTVGCNTVVTGAGAVVVKSVPSNCTVVGNPARIINKNGESVNIKL